MHRSYTALREQYGLPVLPIGLFLKVGLAGIGIDVYEENFWELDALRFKYMYVGLPALNAVGYVQGDNWLGWALAALMKIPEEQAAWLGAEALRRIKEAPLSEQKRFLLGECVDAYLSLDEAQQREFDALLATEKYVGVRAMNKTTFEKGREAGRREMVLELLQEKFGPLPGSVEEKLQPMSLAELIRLSKMIRQAQTLSDLGLDSEANA